MAHFHALLPSHDLEWDQTNTMFVLINKNVLTHQSPCQSALPASTSHGVDVGLGFERLFFVCVCASVRIYVSVY